jgi:hypothetical protein
MSNKGRGKNRQALNDVPIALLRQRVAYDPATGGLTWRARPREHFSTLNAWAVWNARFAGKPALVSIRRGYRRGELILAGKRRRLNLHHVAWALSTGAWAKDELDFINGDTTDNRLANLREATHAENAQNQRRGALNTSGVSGVNWHRQAQKWRARIGIGGRRLSLGVYSELHDAERAYLEAKARLHLFQPVPRESQP